MESSETYARADAFVESVEADVERMSSIPLEGTENSHATIIGRLQSYGARIAYTLNRLRRSFSRLIEPIGGMTFGSNETRDVVAEVSGVKKLIHADVLDPKSGNPADSLGVTKTKSGERVTIQTKNEQGKRTTGLQTEHFPAGLRTAPSHAVSRYLVHVEEAPKQRLNAAA